MLAPPRSEQPAAASHCPQHCWAQLGINTAHRGGTAQRQVKLSFRFLHIQLHLSMHLCAPAEQHNPRAVQPQIPWSVEMTRPSLTQLVPSTAPWRQGCTDRRMAPYLLQVSQNH